MRQHKLVPVLAATVMLAGAMAAGAAPGDQVTVADSTIAAYFAPS